MRPEGSLLRSREPSTRTCPRQQTPVYTPMLHFCTTLFSKPMTPKWSPLHDLLKNAVLHDPPILRHHTNIWSSSCNFYTPLLSYFLPLTLKLSTIFTSTLHCLTSHVLSIQGVQSETRKSLDTTWKFCQREVYWACFFVIGQIQTPAVTNVSITKI
jgi:hypothetical protein